MDRTDFLFRNQLNYQINLNSSDDDQATVNDVDISKINLHHCTYSEFKQALTYAKDNNPEYDFRYGTLDQIKPMNCLEDAKYDFVVLTDSAKNTALVIGNITLLNDLQKVSGAEELLMSKRHGDIFVDTSDAAFDRYMSLDINDYGILEELGSTVITCLEDTYKVTATFHDSSRNERPIVSVRYFSIKNNSYLSNRDIVDITNIYKANATLLEAFAYMSFYDYKKKRKESSFDSVIYHAGLEINDLDDMYSQHYDLRIFDELNSKKA